MYPGIQLLRYETNRSKNKLEKLIHDIRTLRRKYPVVRTSSIVVVSYNTLEEEMTEGLSTDLLNNIKSVSKPSSTGCSICLENYSEETPVVSLRCNHEFHKSCVFYWLEKHTTCPECRCELQIY
jgi:SUMO ligase MMS21 Smc5/6 complex component